MVPVALVLLRAKTHAATRRVVSVLPPILGKRPRLARKNTSAGFALILGGLALFGAGGAFAQHPSTAYPYPWDQPGCPCPEVLRAGTPADAGLVPQALDNIDESVTQALVRRVFPGAVVLVARRGAIAKWSAYGYAAIYTDGDYATATHPLPMPASEAQPASVAPMRKNEVFDLASVTKLFTAVAVMQLWDRGKLKLDDRVASYLPEFGLNGKAEIKIQELLTHTSGLQPDPPTPLYDISGTRAQRLKYAMGLPPEYPPGTHYLYSDINFMVLGALVEKLSGEREDVFVRKNIIEPLRLTSTTYAPPVGWRSRIAATEYQPWLRRGMLRGQVEDGNAWALDGVSGHAGLFSNALDLAVFGQMILNHGTYDGARILSRRAVEVMLTDSMHTLSSARFPGLRQGLGWWLDMPTMAGAMAGPDTAGHEGYTGTMLLIDRRNDVVAVVLTNRVHPNRNGPSVAPEFRHIYTDIANAIPVAQAADASAWFSGYGNDLNRRLVFKIGPSHATSLAFKTWYRIQPDEDYGYVEGSSDGSHWQTIARFSGTSGGWHAQQISLAPATRYIQFRYRTDASINGRGWYVGDIRVAGEGSDVSTQPLGSEWARQDR